MRSDKLTPETAAAPVADGSSAVVVGWGGTTTSAVLVRVTPAGVVEMVLLAPTKVEVEEGV